MDSGNIYDIMYILTYIYIFQLHNFSKDIIGKQLREYISENKSTQHIINFIVILVLISVFDRERSITELLKDTTIVYFFYLLTTKLDLQFNIIILFGILFFYFYKREIDIKEKRILNDFELDNQIKSSLIKNNNKKMQLFQFSLAGLIVFFSFFYFNRKNIQYGGDFSYKKFLFY
jgi:hypothetical protein